MALLSVLTDEVRNNDDGGNSQTDQSLSTCSSSSQSKTNIHATAGETG